MIRLKKALRWLAPLLAVTFAASACSLVGGAEKSSKGRVTVKVALVPDPVGASAFYRAQFDNFMKKNPKIAVEIIENPTDQQLNAVELMFQQGSPPDVFRAQDAGFDRMYERGWVAPLDKHVTEEFTSRFPVGTLDPKTSGLHRDGKLYTLPLVWGKWSVLRLLAYNKKLLAEAGVDAPPGTWEELEKAARAVTKRGGKKVYGYAPGSGTAPGVQMLQNTAGPFSIPSWGVDLRTGKAANSDPSLVEAVELHRQLQAGKVMTPGWESWDGTRAYTEFAKEKLAMFPAAPFQVAEVRKLNEDVEMGIAALPVPVNGRGGYSGQTSSYSPLWSMSAKSKHPAEAWKVMDFLSSTAFHRAYYEEFGTLTALENAWRDQAMSHPDQKAILEVAEGTIRPVPNPILASPGGKALIDELLKKPDLLYGAAALESILRNQPFEPKAKKLDSQLDAFIDETIKKLAAKGVKVSRTDITFADWDPTKPYGPTK